MTLTVCIWGENWCDEDFEITNIKDASLQYVLDFKDQFKQDYLDKEFLEKYRESEIVLDVYYVEPQIGNYPPPNIEVEGHFDFVIVSVKKFEYEYEDDSEHEDINWL